MNEATRRDHEEAMRRAIQSIINGLDAPPDPEAWAAAAGYSRCHFGRLFTALVGEPPFELRRRLLLERAAEQVSGGTPVTEAAIDAGYGSLEAFSRAFSGTFRRPPSEQFGCCWVAAPNRLHWPPNLDLVEFPWRTTHMNFRIEEAEAKTFVGLSHKGPYHLIGQTFGALMGKRRTQGPPGVSAACYLDDPSTTPIDSLRSFAGIEGRPEDEPDLEEMQRPAGRWAVGVHVGSYAGLAQAWMNAYGALAAQGHTAADIPCWEVYLDNMQTTPEDQLRTELWIPIQSKD